MKGKGVSFVCLAAVVVVCLFLSAKVSAAADTPKEILIGVNAPLTGMHAGFGEGNVYGEKAAAQDINKQGGIFIKEYNKKIPVRLIVVEVIITSIHSKPASVV